MVKSYLRYVPAGTVGLICSSDVLFDGSGEVLLSATLETVSVWNHKTGTLIAVLGGEDIKTEVCCMVVSGDGVWLAVGHLDGALRLWDLRSKALRCTLRGHSSAVSALRFNRDGTLLVSGGRDTNIIVWDVVNETGLYKLRGHKDIITDCAFLEKANKIVSSSKDSYLKMWDLETQHCVQTVVGHRNEVWSFDINKDETRLITGSVDNKIRVWSLDPEEFAGIKEEDVLLADEVPLSEEQLAKFMGSFQREGSERVSKIRFSRSNDLLACQGDKSIEFFNVASLKDAEARRVKRVKRQGKRQREKAKGNADAVMSAEQPTHILPKDQFVLKGILRTTSKIRTFGLSRKRNHVAVAFNNNQVAIYQPEPEGSEFKKLSSIELPGHRSDIRSTILSYDDSLLLSTSNNGYKVWNLKSKSCVRTMETSSCLCGVFMPGNRHVVLGTKKGTIEMYDLEAASCIQNEAAHHSTVWSIHMHPDKTRFVTGSGDKTVKFWDLELIQDEENKSKKRLSFKHARTLSMNDEVVCVKYSPNGKLIAAAMLDSTVKILRTENLEFYLSLYGHKLPVLSMDISFDSLLIVTGSADKNLKIWGLDFGDCHKSMFAHDDSILQVQFQANTHYFFTASKDKLIKYWDADKFQLVQTLTAHHGPVWALCLNKSGDMVISGSQDKSLRFWERTDEQLFLEEEREKQMDDKVEENLSKGQDRDDAESGPAGKRSIETIMASERLIEAIELGEDERAKIEEWNLEIKAAELNFTEAELEKRKSEGKGPLVPRPHPNPILLGLSPSEYCLRVLKGIKSSELEESLLVLPFDVVENFFFYLNEWVLSGNSLELVCRCIFYMLKVHQNAIASSRKLLPIMANLRTNTRSRLQNAKDVIGFNKSAIHFIKRKIQVETNTEFFEENMQAFKKRKKERRSFLEELKAST